MTSSSPPLNLRSNDMRSSPAISQSQGAGPPSALSQPLRAGTFNVGRGFARKLPAILSRSAELRLDIVALQEIGDPALLSPQLPSYTLVHQPSSISSERDGVGLLLAEALLPCVLCYHRSVSQPGRLVGVVLQLAPQRSLLVVSAYMPTGLDRCPMGSVAADVACSLYREILKWSVGVHQVLVLGDLNETRSCYDRLPLPHLLPRAGAAADSRPIDILLGDGFADAYRELHPQPHLHPGHTHAARGEYGPTSSRIDYILRKGFPVAPSLRVEIDSTPSLVALSHHRLLWTEMLLGYDASAPCTDPLYRMQLPNLRAATESHLEAFARHAHRSVQAAHDQLSALAAAGDAASLDYLALQLTGLVRESAALTIPITGAAPHRSACLLKLRKQEYDLRRLLRTSEAVLQLYAPGSPRPGNCLSRSPEWLCAQARCFRHHGLRWVCNAWARHADPQQWLRETRELFSQTRARIRVEEKRMGREPREALHVSPAAQVHRMLDGDQLPAQLLTVVRADGSLTSGAVELEHELVDHFRSVFAVPEEDHAELPPDPTPERVLTDKASVQSEWYAGLHEAMPAQEILDALSDASLVSSPGEDEVSTGLWKRALLGSPLLSSLVSRLFSGLLLTSSFPNAWKTSVIVPLVKDASKQRTRGNLRPISLQACLGKLFMQILARRLGSILARHPILHPAQRGFVLGGSIAKCIDELLDAWEWARHGKHELYTLLYDIRQAYDSVQREVLERAMRRLRMPEAFIALVSASLEGLSSRVRTAYGLTAHFDVQRSLRQGDPLAPLLFVILMDALHCGLDVNPFTGEQHGLVVSLPGVPAADSVRLSSLGYADDTSVLTCSLVDLRAQNEWVHTFMRFNRMRLNHTKCEVVGQKSGGAPLTAADLAAADITIEDRALLPVPHSQPIRYLGVQCCFDGAWREQRIRALRTLHGYTRIIDKFSVPLALAAYIVNVFLLPKLELALRYVTGGEATSMLISLDRSLVASMQHAAGLPLTPSNTVVALTLGFALPSWLEASVKVSELFLRMNSDEGRWGRLGRQLMRLQQPVAPIGDEPLLLGGDTRIQRACKLASKLGWQVRLNPEPSRHDRIPHLFERELAGHLPGADVCSGTQLLDLPSGPLLVAHDLWHGWGAAVPPVPQPVHVYTDGSHDPASVPAPTSSWAATVCDRWLLDNYQRLPTDELQLKAKRNEVLLRPATMLGASIACTSGVYPAELQAIARTLALFPVTCPLHGYSDSQGALAGIASYAGELNERRRLRMSSRPLLQLIHHLLAVREKHGASTEWSHVKAHTQGADLPSVGNRLSDCKANVVRLRPNAATPVHLAELPLDKCERHLCLFEQPPVHGAPPRLLSDDIRRTALVQLRTQEQARKLAEIVRVAPERRDDHQSRLFGPELLDLSLVVRRRGSSAHQRALLRVATNSLHVRWPRPPLPPGAAKALRPVPCSHLCRGFSLSVAHLCECLQPPATRFRRELLSAVLALLRTETGTARWIRDARGLSVSNLLRRLFPPSGPSAAHEERTHLARLLCGAFSARAVPAALRALGFASDDRDSGRALLDSLRLLCLQRVDAYYEGRLGPSVGPHPP